MHTHGSSFVCRQLQGPVLIYRFVCHPSIVYVRPTIVYVTSVLIPAKPVQVAELRGVCCRMWRPLVAKWKEKFNVLIRREKTGFPALLYNCAEFRRMSWKKQNKKKKLEQCLSLGK